MTRRHASSGSAKASAALRAAEDQRIKLMRERDHVAAREAQLRARYDAACGEIARLRLALAAIADSRSTSAKYASETLKRGWTPDGEGSAA